MGTLQKINNYRQNNGKVGYVYGLSPTYGNNAFFARRYWSLGTGGEFGDFSGNDRLSNYYTSFLGIMGMSTYNPSISDFDNSSQANTGAGVVALIKVARLSTIMSNYELLSCHNDLL